MPIIRDIWGTRYVRAGIFHPSAFYKFVQNMGCLIALVFLVFLAFCVYWIMLKMSYGVTSVIPPSQSLLNNSFYNLCLREDGQTMMRNIVQQGENAYWQKALAGQNIREIKTEVSSVPSDLLTLRSVNEYDFWYKNDKHSEAQFTCQATTTLSNGYSNMVDENYQKIEIKRCIRILMDVNYKRKGMFIKYEFTPKQIVLFDSNVDENYIINTKKY